MTWTRLSDDHFDREQSLILTRDARLLHVEALVWCNRAGTDGRVPRGALRRLTDLEDPEPFIRELIRAKLWSVSETGWQVDWSDQETHAKVEKRRAETKLRKDRLSRHRDGDHSICLPKYCKDASSENDTENASGTRSGTRKGTSPRPNPARPGPKEPGRERGHLRPAPLRCPNGDLVTSDGTCCKEPETHAEVKAS